MKSNNKDYRMYMQIYRAGYAKQPSNNILKVS